MIISWREGGCRRVLRGDPSLCRSKSSWKSTLKTLRDDGEGLLVNPMIAEGDSRTDPELSQVPRVIGSV